MGATVTVTAPVDDLVLAGNILMHSVERGDFDDDDFEDAAARAAGRLLAAPAVDDNEPDGSVTLDFEPLDEILAVLESDVRAGSLTRFLAAANSSLAATAAPGEG